MKIVMDDSTSLPYQLVHLDVRYDPFTLALLKVLGKVSCIKIDPVTLESTFDLPESSMDLVVRDDVKGIWCPVVGAFADVDNLYLIVEDDGELYIYSSSSRSKQIRYYDDGGFASPWFEVNPLLSSQVCIITNLMEMPDDN